MNNSFYKKILDNYGGEKLNSLLNIANADDEDDNEIKTMQPSPYYALNDFVTHMNCSKHNFTILSLNIQSINAKFNNLIALVDIINKKDSKISAICLQESWIGENDDLSTFQIPNYHCISQPKFCSIHAGLLIYLHKEYNYEIMWDVSHKSAIWESLLINISTPRENK